MSTNNVAPPLIFEAALQIALHRFGPNALLWFTKDAEADRHWDQCVEAATTLYAKTVEATKETTQ